MENKISFLIRALISLLVIFAAQALLARSSAVPLTFPQKRVPTSVGKSQDAPVVVPVSAKEPKSESSSHWTFALVYNLADKMVYGGNVTLLSTPTRFVVTDQTTSQFGVSAGYLKHQPWSWGYGSDLMFEFPRGSKGLSGTAGNTQIVGQYEDDPKISLLTLNASGNYSFGEFVYAFGGLNYPFIFATDSNAHYTGLIGYQAGLGARLHSRWALEAGYRLTAAKGSVQSNGLNLEIKEADFAGWLFQLKYLW